uniref:Uncharacterized protein n=1 Tax=Triticum urartu TaxID=4572 RepID=A0A8R7TRR4_TRIUA
MGLRHRNRFHRLCHRRFHHFYHRPRRHHYRKHLHLYRRHHRHYSPRWIQIRCRHLSQSQRSQPGSRRRRRRPLHHRRRHRNHLRLYSHHHHHNLMILGSSGQSLSRCRTQRHTQYHYTLTNHPRFRRLQHLHGFLRFHSEQLPGHSRFLRRRRSPLLHPLRLQCLFPGN